MPDPARILQEAYDNVRHEYRTAIGQRRDELITPALVLDVDAAQRNINHMASELKQMGGATIRPHYKTHKNPDLARRQLQAGAGGLSMATVWEAAILAAAGISRQSGKVIVDAGNKSVADPADVTMVGHDYKVFRFDGEHGIFDAAGGSPLRVGDPVALVPGYSPSTVNWYDAYHVVHEDIVVDIWPIIPRGPGHHGISDLA